MTPFSACPRNQQKARFRAGFFASALDAPVVVYTYVRLVSATTVANGQQGVGKY